MEPPQEQVGDPGAPPQCVLQVTTGRGRGRASLSVNEKNEKAPRSRESCECECEEGGGGASVKRHSGFASGLIWALKSLCRLVDLVLRSPGSGFRLIRRISGRFGIRWRKIPSPQIQSNHLQLRSTSDQTKERRQPQMFQTGSTDLH